MTSFPPIQFVSQEDAEKAEFLICTRWTTPSFFADDEQGTCLACGELVRFRPHSPKTPARMCVPCLLDKLERSQ